MAVYAFDGTWNDGNANHIPVGEERYTNIFLFTEGYSGDKFYANGPGTRHGFIGKYLGGFSGLGASSRIAEAFEFLKTAFASGDTTIDIIGYSRGAAIARMFVETIRESYYLLPSANGQLDKPPVIRFLGLFDTVGSFGLPWTSDEGDFTPRISSIVENTFHAMALDETRETFGIERCIGDRNRICEVWFRGGHADIGGNAVLKLTAGYETNRQRSNIALQWMARKAVACGLPVKLAENFDNITPNAPVTASEMKVEIGDAGTLSRRIYLGDLVHYTVEDSDIVDGIDGRLLRRINVPTRIEDRGLENKAGVALWVPVEGISVRNETYPASDQYSNPRLIELSSKRYPFDVQPARTWQAWLERWDIDDGSIQPPDAFWAPGAADRALAWDVLVELATRVATQPLGDDEGDDVAALTSIYQLFPTFRQFLHVHGPESSNAATLINGYLNTHVRWFTAKWHKYNEEGLFDGSKEAASTEVKRSFRQELSQMQPHLKKLQLALEELADASFNVAVNSA